jgi:hypothetical protein
MLISLLLQRLTFLNLINLNRFVMYDNNTTNEQENNARIFIAALICDAVEYTNFAQSVQTSVKWK